jgi:hypothetical protein
MIKLRIAPNVSNVEIVLQILITQMIHFLIFETGLRSLAKKMNIS